MSGVRESCHDTGTSSVPSTARRGAGQGSSKADPRLRIALAGNPNTGKTSLFNRLTGSHARVGNYPGVTVELITGQLTLPSLGLVDVQDIPGAYSLVARSAEEEVAIRSLMGLGGRPAPDLVVVCVDATNLIRNLYLTLQLQELGCNVVVALTMMDEARDLGLDPAQLERVLGCPVVPTIPRTGEGLDQLKVRMEQTLQEPRPRTAWYWQPSPSLEQALSQILALLPPEWPSSRGLALWTLMSIDAEDALTLVPAELRRGVLELSLDGEAVDDEVVQGRYRWLDEHIGPLVVGQADRSRTETVDAILIHPVWGFLVFLMTMFVVFQALFAWADPAISLIETLFGGVGDWLTQALPPNVFTELLVEGVIGGVGSVVVFLPQILLLFFFLGLMEDSGYMARVAYLMDRVMRLMGLHGRAFVPMLSGFACAIPAVMATRTMERSRDRILTMMVVPLMTCSARLPVYTLLIGALFPARTVMGFLPVQGALMIGMYLFSVGVALLAAFVLSRTVLKAAPIPLVMELPPYRLPSLKDVLRMMWRRTRMFLSEAGSVILICTILLWALLSFPRHEPPFGATSSAPSVEQGLGQPAAISRTVSETSAPVAMVAEPVVPEAREQGERLRNSYAGRIGRAIEPLIAPLGFDWKIGVGLIGAFAAREVFVSTMGVVYNIGKDVDEESVTLREQMRNELNAEGRPVYSPLTGLSLMVFFALACQCLSTLAVVKRETGGWRWPAFLLVYMTSLAWICSFIIYQGGRLLGLG